MRLADKTNRASKLLPNQPPRNDVRRTQTPLFHWMSIALISSMIMFISMPEAIRAEDDLQTVIEMMKKNSAHLKSFFSHKQADELRAHLKEAVINSWAQ